MEITDPIYGPIEITEPVLLELIETPAMQRLKGVDQNSVGGISKKPWGKFSRFDHSIGAMFLVAKLGGALEEQIAALLHDISHTAFSHAMDFVFDARVSQDFHEKHIERIIAKSNIPEILKKYGYDNARILNHHNFSILEQDLPALCADRVDYALKTFFTSFRSPLELMRRFLHDLALADGKMAFQNKNLAREFADMFLRGDIEIWGGSYFGNTIYHMFAEIVKKANARGEITLDDFFTTDQEFMDKLGLETQKEIDELRKLEFKEVTAQDPHDLHLSAKIRYVDPPVLLDGNLRKLSEIDQEFASRLAEFLARRKLGNYVKIIS